MNNEITKFYARYAPEWDAYELHSIKTDINGNKQIASPICYYNFVPGTMSPPFVRLELEKAQALLQQLWDAGLRPKEVGTLGQLSAMQYHLEDMRRLVFNDRPSTGPTK